MRTIHRKIKNKPLRLTYVKINGIFYLVSHDMQDIKTLDMLAFKKNILMPENLRFARWYTHNEYIEFKRINNIIWIDIYKKQKI